MQTFKALQEKLSERKTLKEVEQIEEKLKVSDGLEAWITDFKDSDAPQFKDADEKKRRDMAIAAFVAAGGKLDEDTEIVKEAGYKIPKNYAQMIAKQKRNKPSLSQNKLSSAEYQKVKKLKSFNKDDWKWNGDLYIRVAEDVEESVDEKTAKDWSAEHARATERAYKKANKKKDAAKAKSASMKKESVELDEAVPGDGKFQKQWRQGAKEVKKGNITLVRGARGAHKVMKGGKQIDDFSFDSESDDFEIGRPGAMGKKRYADSVDDIFKMFESTGAKSLFSLLEELKEGKKPVSQMTPAEKEADAKKRKEYKAYQKSKRNEELEEATAELYFDTYTAAVQHAKAQAEKKGFEVVEDDWFQKVSVGQGKPKEGKTTSHLLKLTKDGKPVRKGLAIQVYNRGAGKKPYELNFYVS